MGLKMKRVKLHFQSHPRFDLQKKGVELKMNRADPILSHIHGTMEGVGGI